MTEMGILSAVAILLLTALGSVCIPRVRNQKHAKYGYLLFGSAILLALICFYFGTK